MEKSHWPMWRMILSEVAESLKIMDKDDVGNVVYLDVLSEIPECDFKLGKKGQKTYNSWCKNLLDAGLLTIKTIGFIENLAIADDLTDKSLRNGGKNMRVAAEMKRSALLKLDKLDADSIIVTPGQSKGAFSNFGFAKRAKQRLHDNN